MPQGLQIWNESGQLILDLTDRLTRVTGDTYVGGTNSSVAVPGSGTGTIWWAFMADVDTFTANFPVFSISGDSLVWSYNAVGSRPGPTPNVTGYLRYGRY